MCSKLTNYWSLLLKTETKIQLETRTRSNTTASANAFQQGGQGHRMAHSAYPPSRPSPERLLFSLSSCEQFVRTYPSLLNPLPSPCPRAPFPNSPSPQKTRRRNNLLPPTIKRVFFSFPRTLFPTAPTPFPKSLSRPHH